MKGEKIASLAVAVGGVRGLDCMRDRKMRWKSGGGQNSIERRRNGAMSMGRSLGNT